MKGTYLVGILIVFTACSNYKQEVERLQQQNDSLVVVTQTTDRKVIEYVKAFNDIQMNLEEIKKAQNIINVTVSEANSDEDSLVQERIIEDINLINDLMLENRNKLQTLERSLSASGKKNKELQKLLDYMQQQIESKDAEIASLTARLEQMNIEVIALTASVDTLTKEIESKNKIIDDKISEMNIAWLVVGTEKELKACNILTKEGGFIGIGKIAQLKTNFEEKCFRKIDISEIHSIPLNVKKAKLLTIHPTASYRFSGTYGFEKLEIVDIKKFWSASRYLVIVIE